jgi:hypothetical protein
MGQASLAEVKNSRGAVLLSIESPQETLQYMQALDRTIIERIANAASPG